MPAALATVTAKLETMPGVWQVHLRAPEIARAARPGQFIMALRSPACDPYLRVAIPLHRISEETIALLLACDDTERGGLAGISLGSAMDILGPLGHGFDLSPRAQNLLLLAEGLGIAPLVATAELAAAQGKKVTLIALIGREEQLYPTELLPREIEYHSYLAHGQREDAFHQVFSEVLSPDMLAWAGQFCAAGSGAFRQGLRAFLQADPIRGRPGFAQVWVGDSFGCGLGLCLSCVVETRRGPRRACTEGPVFDLFDLR